MNESSQLASAKLSSSLMVVIGLLLACSFLLTGCGKQSAGSAIADSPYKVIDTGYWNAEDRVPTEPLWLDNERIIFTSTETLQPGKGPYSVKVWNIATGKIASTQFDTATYSFRCVRDGQVVYTKKGASNNQWIYYRGALENAKEHPAPGSDMQIDEYFDCDWVPKKTYGLGYITLPAKNKLRGENYLEILEERTRLPEHMKRPWNREQEKKTGDAGSKGKVIYHAGPDDSGREVQFYPPWYRPHYSEFLNAYVVGMNYYNPNDPETRSFWILQRNGGLKEIPYPKALHEGQLALYPIKLGYLVEYHTDPIPGADPFNNALYLMQGDQLQRLVAGSIHGVRISPDGCKVAFSHAKKVEDRFWSPKPRNTVKLINFCQGGATP